MRCPPGRFDGYARRRLSPGLDMHPGSPTRLGQTPT